MPVKQKSQSCHPDSYNYSFSDRKSGLFPILPQAEEKSFNFQSFRISKVAAAP